MDLKEEVVDRFNSVKGKAEEALIRSGRKKDPLVLVAVTKYAAIDQVRSLLNQGHVDFGESKVQHLQQISSQAQEILNRKDFDFNSEYFPNEIRWHFIGHLQRNKTRDATAISRLIHSMDSLKIAEAINSASKKQKKNSEVLIQINIGGEKQKYGLIPAAIDVFLDQAIKMENIKIRGLMCMAPQSNCPENSRSHFVRMREIFEDVKCTLPPEHNFNLLSMGMSNDFEIALECGANVIRVGSAIFGE